MTPEIRIEHDLEMKTRDGLVLRADVWRPYTDEPVPAIVIRTPYDKASNHSVLFPPVAAARAGFAVVIQDVRGRFASEGEHWPGLDLWQTEGDDGEDTLEWIASLPWSNGTAGTFGPSYLAEVQYALAARRPSQLRAIAPAMHSFTRSWIRQVCVMLEPINVTYGAGMALDLIMRRLPTGEASLEDLAVAVAVMEDPAGACEHLPVSEHPVFNLPGFPAYADLEKTKASIFAAERGRGERDIAVPALMTTGWFDSQQGGAAMFRLMRDCAPTASARDESCLVIGPWTHTHNADFVGEWGNTMLGSPAGALVPQMHADFFRRHLAGDTSVAALPRVRYFVMGANQWRTAEDWPIPGTEWRPMYLRSGGHANSERGDGMLTWEAPGASDPHDRYRYDPHEPVPSVGGRAMYTGGSTLAGPFNQTRIERRDDVLVYTSSPLDQPVEVVGPVAVRLWISSSAIETDFVVKLCDVAPDGVSVNVADGMYRTGWLAEDVAGPAVLEPGDVYEVEVDLGATGHAFRAGHAIRVSVTSSGFPLWLRNMNTGGDPATVATGVVANQTVRHDGARPSHVLLPVQPR